MTVTATSTLKKLVGVLEALNSDTDHASFHGINKLRDMAGISGAAKSHPALDLGLSGSHPVLICRKQSYRLSAGEKR
jgi:hypothetical protein